MRLGSNDGWKARILGRLNRRITKYEKELSDPSRIRIQDFEVFVRLDEAKRIRTAIKRMKPPKQRQLKGKPNPSWSKLRSK